MEMLPLPTLLVTKSLGKLIHQTTNLGKVTGLKEEEGFWQARGCGFGPCWVHLGVAHSTLSLELEDVDTAISSAPVTCVIRGYLNLSFYICELGMTIVTFPPALL